MGLHPEGQQRAEQRQKRNRPGGVVDGHPLSLEVAERVDVGAPGAPPEQNDQREADAAGAGRRDDGECRERVAEGGLPVWIAWVNPASAMTGAAKSSPSAMATPSG